MRWLALSLLFIAGCQWAYARGYGAAALMSGWFAVGCITCGLKPGLFTRLMEATED
jgi:hypothetical protein